ncbi:GNAT family N-acetyltransferase [Microbacterium azadirachtae]|uniref:Putative acetyltransferase n=1 Tax=Microbacterium azadirachtae TaxID=582680 RepID=A0A0F0LIF5_9MICO|nr:GNAT family N-acetyltransferase [Microbacterium azadirachtae]KJL31306.1 putative acetyltransferase [Microbacterium azadirachtae]
MQTIEIGVPGTADADGIVRTYLTEVVSRYHGRPATDGELSVALADEPYDDLQGDTGILLLARDGGAAVACAGARFVEGDAELTKVFTLPSARGRGIARRLILALEEAARDRGARSLRLNTRSDLVEACAMYEGLGFRSVEAFNAEPYADRWYRKDLTSAAEQTPTGP